VTQPIGRQSPAISAVHPGTTLHRHPAATQVAGAPPGLSLPRFGQNLSCPQKGIATLDRRMHNAARQSTSTGMRARLGAPMWPRRCNDKALNNLLA